MTAILAPQGKFMGLDNDGDPLDGGLLYTYEAGTTTPKDTYTDNTENTANSNPVVLDANGYADVWLGDGNYKFILKDKDNVDIWGSATDNIIGSGGTGDLTIIATGTTEPISIADRFAFTVDPKDFGATGDGTTDDSVAIQSTITYANANDKIVSLTDVYKIGDSTNITDLHNVEYTGKGGFLCDGNNFYPNASFEQPTLIYYGSGGLSTNDGLSSSKPVVDINGALDVIKSNKPLGKISLQQVAGEVDVSVPQEIDIEGRIIYIEGDNDVGYTFSSQISFTSNGAGDHDLVLEFSSDISAFSVGEFMKIRAGNGTGAFAALCGFHEVTAVDTGTNRITLNVKAVNASFSPTPTLTSGVFVRIPAGIAATSSMVADSGVIEVQTGCSANLNNMYVLGDKTVSTLSCLQLFAGGELTTGQGFALARTSRSLIYALTNNRVNCIDIAGSDAGSNGYYALKGGSGELLRANFSGISGAAIIGDSTSISCSQSRVGGNANNVQAYNGASVTAGSAYFQAATGNSQYADESGIIENINNTHEYNATAFDVSNGGKIYLGSSEVVTGNIVDYAVDLNKYQADSSQIIQTNLLTLDQPEFERVKIYDDIDFDEGSRVAGTGGNVYLDTVSANRDIITRTGTTEIMRVEGNDKAIRFDGASGVGLFNGSGSPEGSQTAPVGSLYMRTDGGASTSFYVKESGTGNTGWVAK